MNYLNSHNLITDHQMAYIKGRSTETALSFLTNTWLKNIDNGLYTCALMIDLSKCFDSVHHGILLQKLVSYEITNTEYSWFKSYVDNRQQVVNFNNQISDKENLNIGVPQGTVLGPNLFLIYMNELPNILPYNSSVMFADDISIFSAAKNLNDATVTLQNITNQTVEWLDNSRFTINISKCNSIVICSKHKKDGTLNIHIKGEHIQQISECRLLGVHIDQNLCFNTQCYEVCKQIFKKLEL